MLARNLSITNEPTVNVTPVAVGSTLTYSASGGGANLRAADIVSALNGGTFNVVRIDTGTSGSQEGDITVSSSIIVTLPALKTLDLRADNDVKFNSGADITANGNKLNVILNSDHESNGFGAVKLNQGTAITSNGGNITLGGGVSPSTLPARGTSDSSGIGILIDGATLSSGTGDISIQGQGQPNSANFNFGVQISGGTVESTSGNITIYGKGGGSGGASDKNRGVSVVQNGKVQVTTGQMNIEGRGGTGDSSGVRLVSDDLATFGRLLSTGTGSITITGTGHGSGANRGKGLKLHGSSQIGGASAQGDITLTLNEIEVTGGSIQSSGSLTIRPVTASSISTGTSTSGSLKINQNALAALVNGFSDITIGDTANTTTVDVGDSTFRDPLTIIGTSTISARGAVALQDSLTADHLAINPDASLGAAGSVLKIQPFSSNRPIRLGAEQSGELSLTDAELDRISKAHTAIGSVNAGNVVFSSTVAPAIATTLEIITGKDITQNFSGTAFVGNELIVKGDLAPALANTGVFNTNSSVTFDATASYEVNLNGTGNHDQLVVAGNGRTTTLGGAQLLITPNSVPAMGSGEVFRIVDSTGTGSTVSGTFRYAGVPLNNGATFTVGSTKFRINYNPPGASGDVILTEASTRPQVNLSVSANSGTEVDETVITVTATADAAVSGNQTVRLAVNGTGITAADYTLSNDTIPIPGGQSSGHVTFTVQDDAVVEALIETATLMLHSPSAGLTLGPNITEDIAITDNDSALLWISDSTLDEGNANNTEFRFTVTLDTSVDTDVTVTYSTADGTATTADSDYTAKTDSLTFPANSAASATMPATVQVTGDMKFEADETFFVDLSNILANGRNVTFADFRGMGTVINDDAMPLGETEVTLSAGVLTITDINGGTSDDDLAISYSGGTYTITDGGGLIINTTIADAAGDGTASVTIPDTGVTSIVFNSLGGDDTIKVNSVQPSLPGGFTIDDGQGADSAVIAGALDTSGGDIDLTVETLTTGDLLSAGGGNITATVDHLTIGATLSGTASLTIQPYSPSATIGIGGGTGTLNLTDAELAYLDGFNSITIGNAIAGDLDIDTATFTAPLHLITGGTIHDATGTDIDAGTNSVTLIGNVAPGQSPGILNVNGNFAFGSGASFEAEILGNTPGTGHDQIAVGGTVDINNATLNIDGTGFTAVGNEFIVLIDNDGTDAVVGTFNGLSEGTMVTVGGKTFPISYSGGTGNDVVLGSACSFEVTNTDDDGPGSLRHAITCSNNTAGTDTITFDIPGPGPHTIALLSPLPAITDPAIIDGTSEPDFAGTPVVELDGSSIGADGDGVKIAAAGSGSTLRGLAINRFPGHGIFVSRSDGNRIEQNRLGTDPTGTIDLGNGQAGLHILNGENNMVVGNLISGNGMGVVIEGPQSIGNLIQANVLGAGVDGNALKNRLVNVDVAAAPNNVIGGTGGLGNVVVGSQVGIGIRGSQATGNMVLGNFIGNTPDGAAIANNRGVQIKSSATNNTIGGPGEAGNVISGNTKGVLLSGVENNLVHGNKIGTNAAGDAALPNIRGVLISGASNNQIGNEANVISGNTRDGLRILGTSATGNVIRNNFIGTNAAGDASLANRNGLLISPGANSNTIGGATAAERNVISGNTDAGIVLQSDDNSVVGNFIGTDATGTSALGNETGVLVLTTSGNTIGGAVGSSEGNVISGNTAEGVRITGDGATDNTVTGNVIGTDFNGMTALGNKHGVVIESGGNTVGGATAVEGNVISGNTQNGVYLIGVAATGNLIQSNRIGINIDGNGAVANERSGVLIEDASDNKIGGADRGNAIGGNTQQGIRIAGVAATSNEVQGNSIGFDGLTMAVLANGDGVRIVNDASNNMIGGVGGLANEIAFNTGRGVWITGGAGNAVTQNSIHDNGGLGIDLNGLGVTPNDAGDADTGPNNLQNTPVIYSVVRHGDDLHIGYQVDSAAANSAGPLRIEFFEADAANEEGRIFLGSAVYDLAMPADQEVTLNVAEDAPLGSHIVATATDAGGNTSEFSLSTEVHAPLQATNVEVIQPTTHHDLRADQLGHTAGLADLYDADAEDDLMYGWLDAGLRRMSLAGSLADAALADW